MHRLPAALAALLVACAAALACAGAAQAATTNVDTSDLCALLTADNVDQLRATTAPLNQVPGIVPSSWIVSTGRSKLACDSTASVAVDPAQAKVKVCAALTIDQLNVLADRLGATPGVKSNITQQNVDAARHALACPADPATPAASTGSTAASSAPGTIDGVPLKGSTGATGGTATTPAATGTFSEVKTVPQGAADTGSW